MKNAVGKCTWRLSGSYCSFWRHSTSRAYTSTTAFHITAPLLFIKMKGDKSNSSSFLNGPPLIDRIPPTEQEDANDDSTKTSKPKHPRRSGLQREVLKLYKELLKTSRVKAEDANAQRSLQEHIRKEFRENQGLSIRKELSVIEWQLRKGYSQLEVLKSSKRGVGFSVFTPSSS